MVHKWLLPYPVSVAGSLEHLLQSMGNVKMTEHKARVPHPKRGVQCHTHVHCHVTSCRYTVWMIVESALRSIHDCIVTWLSCDNVDLHYRYLMMNVLSMTGQVLMYLACSNSQSLKHWAAKWDIICNIWLVTKQVVHTAARPSPAYQHCTLKSFSVYNCDWKAGKAWGQG